MTVVEAVGARLSGQASVETLVSRKMPPAWARVEVEQPERVMRVAESRFRVGRRRRSSSVSPL